MHNKIILLAFLSGVLGNVCNRSYSIRTKSDLNSVKACTTINGGLYIEATEPLDINLNLVSINGQLSIQGESVNNVKFDKLVNINGGLKVQARNSEAVNFNSLKTINGKLSLVKLDLLKQLDFTKLRSINGDLEIENLASIENIELPSVKVICNQLSLKGSNKLKTFKLPSMEAYEVRVSIDSDSLTEVNLGKMVEMKGSNINYKNKSALKLNTVIEKTCKANGFIRYTGDENNPLDDIAKIFGGASGLTFYSPVSLIAGVGLLMYMTI